MKIFGLGYGGFHDSNIAIMEDGKVLNAVSEERLSGVKKDGRFPIKAIDTYYSDDIRVLCVSNLQDNGFKVECEKANIIPREETLEIRSKVFTNIQSFSKKFDQVFFYSHQDCHAASAYYFSGFKHALVVTWDAGSISEPWNFTVNIGNNNKLLRVHESTNGLPALNYAAVTALSGFIPERHEGKITGLAAHGVIIPNEVKKIKDVLSTYESSGNLLGGITKWKNVGSKENVPTLKVDRNKTKDIFDELNISKENLAAIIQHLTEVEVLTAIRKFKSEYPNEDTVCLAGGLFANVLLNKKIKELGFNHIYIHPAMGDDGLALGACAQYFMSKNIKPNYEDTVFWGPGFTDIKIEKAILKKNLVYYKTSDLGKDLAKKLSEDKIIARFSGKMEYGPRSLGNRSIIASATKKEINNLLNKKLRRTEFMPFAPITLEENEAELYKNTGGLEKALKFMTIAVDCTEICKEKYPAIVHIDGTARPQIVGEENPGLKNILQEYQNLTGLSTLINTSFNMHEGPIVCTPDNAIDTFVESQLDCLAMENYIILNKKH